VLSRKNIAVIRHVCLVLLALVVVVNVFCVSWMLFNYPKPVGSVSLLNATITVPLALLHVVICIGLLW